MRMWNGVDRRLRHQSKGRFWWLFFFFIAFFGIAAVAIFFFGGSAKESTSTAVVLMSDPVVVVFWNKTSGTVTHILLPADTVIDGVGGYGKYSLEGLWKLGAIDKKEGTILSESVEELLGIPVSWYVGGRHRALLQTKNSSSLAKEAFALPALLSFFSGAYTSNMPYFSIFSLSWTFSHIRPDSVRTIDLLQGDVLIEQGLPDGSTRRLVDKERLDRKIGSLLEDEAIRKEGISVAVYNTTQSPFLGTQAARLLEHMGVRVVEVGNDSPQVDRCTLWGGKKVLRSATGVFIRHVYDCLAVEGEDANGQRRADLIVRLGSRYQARFLPFGATAH